MTFQGLNSNSLKSTLWSKFSNRTNDTNNNAKKSKGYGDLFKKRRNLNRDENKKDLIVLSNSTHF